MSYLNDAVSFVVDYWYVIVAVVILVTIGFTLAIGGMASIEAAPEREEYSRVVGNSANDLGS